MENPDTLFGVEESFAPDRIPVPSIDLATGSWNLIGRYGVGPELSLTIAFELLEDLFFKNNVLENLDGDNWGAADTIDLGRGYWLRTKIAPEIEEGIISYEPGSYYFED